MGFRKDERLATLRSSPRVPHGNAIFREAQEIRHQIDYDRRSNGQEQAAGHGLPPGPPHLGLAVPAVRVR